MGSDGCSGTAQMGFASKVGIHNKFIIWVCLKIVYLIFQWIITMFPIKIAICGYPLFSEKPICDNMDVCYAERDD